MHHTLQAGFCMVCSRVCLVSGEKGVQQVLVQPGVLFGPGISFLFKYFFGGSNGVQRLTWNLRNKSWRLDLNRPWTFLSFVSE